ncbi:MAG: DUF4382 domain-containing protein [Cyclobacteriaceae bacterium]|nr:DUF4382 domain-containing protein [Cyclobacteriaceae bacterium SS2]
MKRLNYLLLGFLTISTLSLLTSCNDDSDTGEKGSANVEVTDAAVDAENISGVYLAVSEIQASANGSIKTLATFDTPIIFNVMDYQEGATFDLGSGDLDVGVYDELRLILADGSPSDVTTSSYIEYTDQTTAALEIPSGTTTGYKVKGDFQISANNQTNLVIDIDLRKALVKTSETFKLRPTARLVVNETLSTIHGEVSNYAHSSDQKVAVYAYLEGTYEAAEAEEPAAGESRFENSINSAVVKEDGTFTLAFMEEGNYEIVVASYQRNPSNENEFLFEGTVDSELMLGTNILNLLSIESSTNISINLVLNN